MSSETKASGDEAEKKSLLHRAIGASAIGNMVEWFDYGLYAYGAVIISQVLFPASDNSLFWAFAVFAISFLVRPLGGFVWGPLGDKLGRKAVLAMTIVMMSSATFLVAFVPPYAVIGIAAPIILSLLRMIQGFSTGGEYAGAATFMAEYAPPKKRGFYGSFLEFGTLAGFNLGALFMLVFQLVLTSEQMLSWGWRVPFLIAGPLGLIGMYIRSKMEDTPVFRELEEQEAKQQNVSGVYKELFGKYLPQVLKVGGMVVALNVVNYTLLSYMPAYLEKTIELSATNALAVPIVGQFAMMIVLPFMGALSDKVGRKPLWIASLAGLTVLAIPMYMLMGTGFVPAMIAFAVLGLLYTPQLATISATFPAMFPTTVRFAGLAIAYNVSTSLFGGTAGAVNEEFIGITGDNIFPAYYMMGACVIGFIAVILTKETKGVPINGTEVPGSEESLAEQKQLAEAAAARE